MFFSLLNSLLAKKGKTTFVQVKYVFMETEQAEAYKEAIDEYRNASQARLAKLANVTSNDAAAVFPKRQISNYFMQFRKVLIYSLYVTLLFPQTASRSDFDHLMLMPDCKSSITSQAYLQ